MCSLQPVAQHSFSFSCHWWSLEQLDLSETASFTASFLPRAADFPTYSPHFLSEILTSTWRAWSDILYSSISLPLIYIQLMFDVFQQGWPCRVVRYLNMLWPSVTMNNLMVISTERYFSTRPIPRSFSVSWVRRLIFGAWVAGSLQWLLHLSPLMALQWLLQLSFELDNNRYTVVFKIENTYLPMRVIFAIYAVLQHVLPSIILSCINISLIKTV